MIDLTHDIPPFDVRAGSARAGPCISYVPSGVVLAVVDPGVGTDRRAVAIEVADGEGVVRRARQRTARTGGRDGRRRRAGRRARPTRSTTSQRPGATFAGRDVFAPVAAHLCNGVDLAELGEPIDADLLLPGVGARRPRRGRRRSCEVLWVDRFGNCQLNVGPDEVERAGVPDGAISVRSSRRDVWRMARRSRRSPTSAPAPSVLVVDSYGMLALCSTAARRPPSSGSAPATRSCVWRPT